MRKTSQSWRRRYRKIPAVFQKGKADLELISAQTMQSLQIAVESRETGSVKSANAVRVLEQSVDQLEGEMREKHIRQTFQRKM